MSHFYIYLPNKHQHTIHWDSFLIYFTVKRIENQRIKANCPKLTGLVGSKAGIQTQIPALLEKLTSVLREVARAELGCLWWEAEDPFFKGYFASASWEMILEVFVKQRMFICEGLLDSALPRVWVKNDKMLKLILSRAVTGHACRQPKFTGAPDMGTNI